MKTLVICAALSVAAYAAVFVAPSSQRPADTGTVAQIYYIKAKPGKLDEYSKYIREFAAPIDEEARKQGAFLTLTTYLSSKPDSPWTHMRIFICRDRAQLDALSKALDDAKLKLHPDEAKRRTGTDYSATLRDFVGSDVVDLLR